MLWTSVAMAFILFLFTHRRGRLCYNFWTGSTEAMKQVVAALIVKDAKVLVCQRTRHQSMPLKWEFPGGKVEPGEAHRDALLRELEEELGILAKIGPLVTTIQHTYAGGAGFELHFFLVHEFDGELQNRIFREVRWAQKTELPALDFLEADVPLVKKIAAGELF